MTEGIDVDEIREDFPIFRNHPDLVYLDSAATSQKPEAVIEAVRDFYRMRNANIHRGIYQLSEEATAAYEDAHRQVADFIDAPSWKQVIFTRNTTESINLVMRSWAMEEIGEGDEVVLTKMEHHSNLVPWQFLAGETGAELRFVELDGDELDMEDLREKITEDTKLVAFPHCSNVLGTINDAETITEIAHDHGARVLLDAAQSVPHMPVDVQELDVDFLVFSGHKMCGPTGIGVLYAKRELLEEMDPFLYGGDMISKVSYRDAEWNSLPWKFEAGTGNLAGGVGLAAAVSYLQSLGMEEIHRHERELAEYALERLSEMDGVTVYGPEERGGLVSFNLDGVHPHDLASLLDDEDVAIRAGHHCAQPLMGDMGIEACARASFHVYNDRSDIDALAEAIEGAKEVFG